ncbi:hypothetical protein QJQ45_027422, partial [Haematococcus lacustris]
KKAGARNVAIGKQCLHSMRLALPGQADIKARFAETPAAVVEAYDHIPWLELWEHRPRCLCPCLPAFRFSSGMTKFCVLMDTSKGAMSFHNNNENLHDFILSPCAPLFHLALNLCAPCFELRCRKSRIPRGAMKPHVRSSIRHRAIASIVLACLALVPQVVVYTSYLCPAVRRAPASLPAMASVQGPRFSDSLPSALPMRTLALTLRAAAIWLVQHSSVVDVICSTADLAVFCKVIQSATRSPHVARLMDPQLHATVFAPTDRAFNEDEARLGQLLGVSGLAQLLTSPRVAAELVASHVITDHIVQEAQLQQERLFHNLLGHTLEVDASTLDGGLHIRGPASSVRLCSGPAPQVPLQASASIIYRVEGVLAARFPALPSFRAAMR